MPNTWITVLLSLCVVIALFFYQYPDVFYRPMPEGLCSAKLSNRPNWVSSLVAADDSHHVSALPVVTDMDYDACLKKIHPAIKVTIYQGNVLGYRRTRVFGFTDWFCITTKGEITSSATLGYSDFGVNRAFVSKLRACLQ